MRSEQRAVCLERGYAILLWLTGCENFNAETLENIRTGWASLLIPPGDNEREKETFLALEDLREEIQNM